MSLDLIIGPMFSGKTTELIRRLNTLSAIGKKCVYINSSLDNREKKDFSSHNPDLKSITKIDSMKVQFINYQFIENIKKYDVIGIDECQLFGVNFITTTIRHIVDKLDKKVIISGLNGDFKRNKFGKIIDLIPECDSIIKLYPYCSSCSLNGKIEKALFSKKITGSDNIVDIGYDNYIPVCRKCYNN
tara:strand:+ start:756 stop:1316 length:561 start_codon:yes stop_codon:yes gene_type:complete